MTSQPPSPQSVASSSSVSSSSAFDTARPFSRAVSHSDREEWLLSPPRSPISGTSSTSVSSAGSVSAFKPPSSPQSGQTMAACDVSTDGAGAGAGADAGVATDAGFVSPSTQQAATYSARELRCTRTLLLTGSDVASKRSELLAYFHATFSLYEALFALLVGGDEAYLQQPDLLRHPLIFYYGHTAVFFVNKLLLAGLLHARINPHVEAVCAVGVDEMSWDDCNTKHYHWPTVAQLTHYRQQVRAAVAGVIATLPLTLPITQESAAWTILMGIEHERIHLETSSVLFRQLPLRYIKPNPDLFPVCPLSRSQQPERVPANSLVPIPAGEVRLGKLSTDATYGWDNEYGERRESVPAMSAASMLVSNAEYLLFVQAEGYRHEQQQQQQWWSEEGLRYIRHRQLTAPLFWVRSRLDDGTYVWKYRTITHEIDMPWDWPVDVNYLEAAAFCRWKSASIGVTVRLPTEAEWLSMRECAYPLTTTNDEQVTTHSSPGLASPASSSVPSSLVQINDQPYWARAPGNINLEHWASASPVDLFPFGRSGLCDVIGNVWQWTETPIAALPGFAVHPLYDDFSVPTFDGRHHLLMGGSFISTGNEALRSARYAFRRHFMQHAGFRYVQSDAPLPPLSDAVFTESDPAIAAVLHEQFAPHQPLQLPNFADQLAAIALTAAAAGVDKDAAGQEKLAVCEVGCGAGRVSFQLAASGRFSRVVGVDRTARLIRLAAHLQQHSSSRGGHVDVPLPYTLTSEGALCTYHEVSLAGAGIELGQSITSWQTDLQFVQGDVNNLHARHVDGVQLLVLNQALEQLADPGLFLAQLVQRIPTLRVLVLATSFAWDDALTACDKRLGGRRENGEALSGERALLDALSPHFALLQPASQLTRATYIDQRSCLLRTVHVSAWQRRQ